MKYLLYLALAFIFSCDCKKDKTLKNTYRVIVYFKYNGSDTITYSSYKKELHLNTMGSLGVYGTYSSFIATGVTHFKYLDK